MNRKAACLHRWCFAHVAAQTDRIRLGTAIITLPMENPLRVAEDAAVLIYSPTDVWRWGLARRHATFVSALRPDQRAGRVADHLAPDPQRRRGDTLSHPTTVSIRRRRSWRSVSDRHLLGGGRHPRRRDTG